MYVQCDKNADSALTMTELRVCDKGEMLPLVNEEYPKLNLGSFISGFITNIEQSKFPSIFM